MSLKKYMTESEMDKRIKTVKDIYNEVSDFTSMLGEWKNRMRGSIQSAAMADRLSREESDSVSAYRNFIKNIDEATKHLEFLQKNMKEYYKRDL